MFDERNDEPESTAEVRTEAAQTPGRLPLSVCAMTRGGSGRLAAVLRRLRPLAEEIVIALDDRGEGEATRLAAVADAVVLFPYRDPGDSVIPWLHAQCRAKWILNLDDDEVPSARLLGHLAELLEADVSHWWLPRRWLFGDDSTYLAEPPWVPDYQLRLYRNDPATLRFSDQFHRPVVVSGAAGFARDPVWHLDLLLNRFDSRREKAIRYERSRRGMRVAGLAHNSGFYLPELRPSPLTAAVPEADRRLIQTILAEPASRQGVREPLRRASRDEIDALWPGEPFDPSTWAGRLTPLETLARLPAAARHTVTVTVENHGAVSWQRGPDASPLIQIGTRWLDDDATIVEDGLHTPMPADLPPGGSLDVPVHLRAPDRPGHYKLSIDLVHEHVRWFGCPIEWTIEVVPARRVALVGRSEPLEEALDRIQLEPELEPTLLAVDETGAAAEFGHTRLPGLGGYLLAEIEGPIGPLEFCRLSARTTRLLRRARRLRLGKATAPLAHGAEECLHGLARCERLLITCPDWDDDAAPTRHFWRLAATAAAARRLGLAVELAPNALAPTGAIQRLLTRLVQGPRDSTAR